MEPNLMLAWGTRVEPPAGRPVARRLAISTLVLGAFFGLAVCLQWLSGAYHAELSGYPDEPAHFVSGVFVHDYLTTLPPQRIVPFAKSYYILRPKLAIGHWPPLLYALEGVWFALFHVSRAAALALMALITASMAASLYRVIQPRWGTLCGIASGLVFLGLSLVQVQTSEVMADMLVAVFAFWATVWFGRFLINGRTHEILGFAGCALLAIFTKNSGLYLFFLPLISMLLIRDFGALRSGRFWLGGAAIAIPSALWLLVSHRFVADYWAVPPGSQFLHAWREDLGFIYLALGPWLLLLIGIGSVRDLIGPRPAVDRVSAALTAAALSVLLFQSIGAPVIEWRFLSPAIAALIPALFSGLGWLTTVAGPQSVSAPVRTAALLSIAVLLSPSRFAIPHKPYRGFSEVADLLTSEPHLRRGVTLVSSSTDGEGLLISEVLMRYPFKEGLVLRASKALAEEDWQGRAYRSRFMTVEETSKYLEYAGVDLVVIDEQDGVPTPLHQELLLQAAKEQGAIWREVGVFPQKFRADLKGSRILVYQRVNGRGSIDKAIGDMEQILSRKLGSL